MSAPAVPYRPQPKALRDAFYLDAANAAVYALPDGTTLRLTLERGHWIRTTCADVVTLRRPCPSLFDTLAPGLDAELAARGL